MKKLTVLVCVSLTFLIIFLWDFSSSPLYAQNDDSSYNEKKLEKIYTLAVKYKLYFFAHGNQKSYVIIGNSFSKTKEKFYEESFQSMVADDAQYPSLETVKKLVEISKAKSYKLYLKSSDKLYYINNKYDVKKITPEQVANGTEEETVAPPPSKEDESGKAEVIRKRKDETENKTRKGQKNDIKALQPGFYLKNINIDFKKITLGSAYTYTPQFIWAPYFQLYNLPIPVGIMFQLGVSPIRGTTQIIYAIDGVLFLTIHYPIARQWAPTIYVGYGKQFWTSVGQNFSLMQYGIGLWTKPLLLYIDQLFIMGGSMKRSDGTIQELKVGAGISF